MSNHAALPAAEDYLAVEVVTEPRRRWRAAYQRSADERVNKVTSIPFVLVHLVPLAALWVGVTLEAVVLGVVLYVVRMFFITAGYHRYFAHRAYRLARVPQFVMAFGGTMAMQKGPLWWAGHHRDHHRTSDTEADIHSPLRGFWWSHVGWILCDKYNDTPTDRIKDFAKYPELRFLNRFDWIGPWALGITCYLIAGWSGLIIGFFASTVLLWHGTFVINSLAHVMGRRRYATEDTSRNSALLAVVTLGEGWHNNHHYYQASARQGFFWWEFDVSYYVLRALSWVGIVGDLKTPSAQIKASNRIRSGAFDIGTFRAHMARATAAVAATGSTVSTRLATTGTAVGTAIATTGSTVGTAIASTGHHAADRLADTKTAVTDGIGHRKEALEEFVRHSLESAEELARASRLDQRRLDLAGD
jgi:stearoyl-CoA desaturase (delta-9 desaturase)